MQVAAVAGTAFIVESSAAEDETTFGNWGDGLEKLVDCPLTEQTSVATDYCGNNKLLQQQEHKY